MINAMDMQDEWLRDLRSWASDNGSVRELWLFGSRATGRSGPDSDVDIALALMPATDGTDWALGNYFALHGNWKRELEAIVGRHVSLEAIVPDTPEDEAVRRSGALLWPTSVVADDDDDEIDIRNWLEAQDHALAIHEAGHTVVARALGGVVVYVEMNLLTGDGGSRSSTFVEPSANLAVCVAGCRAEHIFEARSPRSTKKGDLRSMRRLLSDIPEAERRAARAEGYRLADEALKGNAEIVRGLAEALMARRWSSDDEKVRIEGEELAALLAGTRPCG
ncbi:nucleotidyltransferase domain-containing protein [Bradyrhizobium japonicum]|uniref:nucleotidyltransferase domain-containing protein n=2 Tax=Bradyrhizobium japonicum TaxID=375 RepID=UPI001E3296A7|nr:nucleotidyltransferase domain-containing protein [Bradyrhizobium japonicum]MCD9110089.1 nucleotidyltransferase domain-containing protein [Bradyrhizobium japonicum]MCD9891711.1 nucleotidyltransferase domain-containing protein [Bradyrhizobium japonicum]MCS3982690.1 putative nucleotidyltransferase [Bradyrhizobium japonicum]MEB2670741.1 nucleotidyltransferase domain-containing protein [Bradyrhizobium japonicum]WLB29003.1 nucleotidyltransferase domain-containing protein [Bradyrhizobium japonicum